MFTIVNDIYPTKEALYRREMHQTGQCPKCRVSETKEHYFVECQAVREVWNHMKTRHRRIMEGITNQQILALDYEEDELEDDRLQMLVQTVEYIKLERNRSETVDLGKFKERASLFQINPG